VKKDPVSSRFIIPGSNILFTAQLLFSFFTAAQKPERYYLLLTTYHLPFVVKKTISKKEKGAFLLF
jgi:hypothetical protein